MNRTPIIAAGLLAAGLLALWWMNRRPEPDQPIPGTTQPPAGEARRIVAQGPIYQVSV